MTMYQECPINRTLFGRAIKEARRGVCGLEIRRQVAEMLIDVEFVCSLNGGMRTNGTNDIMLSNMSWTRYVFSSKVAIVEKAPSSSFCLSC